MKKEEKLFVGNSWKYPDNFFVFSNEFGKPPRADSLYQTWRRFTAKHGIRHVRFHDLRHTSATLLAAKKIDINVISRRLGHTQARTTNDIYIHAVQELEDEAAMSFEELFN